LFVLRRWQMELLSIFNSIYRLYIDRWLLYVQHRIVFIVHMSCRLFDSEILFSWYLQLVALVFANNYSLLSSHCLFVLFFCIRKFGAEIKGVWMVLLERFVMTSLSSLDSVCPYHVFGNWILIWGNTGLLWVTICSLLAWRWLVWGQRVCWSFIKLFTYFLHKWNSLVALLWRKLMCEAW